MKIKNISLLLLLAGLLGFSSCDDEKLDSTSVFDGITPAQKNEFDNWLETNYRKVYNIDFKYRYSDKEADRAYNAEKAMIGVDLNSDKALEETMYKAIQEDIAPRKKPRLSNWISGDYRRELIPVLTKRAARKAAFGECMLCKQEEA